VRSTPQTQGADSKVLSRANGEPKNENSRDEADISDIRKNQAIYMQNQNSYGAVNRNRKGYVLDHADMMDPSASSFLVLTAKE